MHTGRCSTQPFGPAKYYTSFLSNQALSSLLRTYSSNKPGFKEQGHYRGRHNVWREQLSCPTHSARLGLTPVQPGWLPASHEPLMGVLPDSWERSRAHPSNSTAAQHSSALCESEFPRDYQGAEKKQIHVLQNKCLGGTESRPSFPPLDSDTSPHFLPMHLISYPLMLSLLQFLAPTPTLLLSSPIIQQPSLLLDILLPAPSSNLHYNFCWARRSCCSSLLKACALQFREDQVMPQLIQVHDAVSNH